MFKVAHHEDQILSVLYEKKHSIQVLLFLASNMSISDELAKH